MVSFGTVARCRAPHPGRAIQSSGVPAANGGARLRGRLRGSLPCSRRRRPVFGRGVGGGGVSYRSGVARSPVRGAVFAPGGRVAAGRGRVPPYGPQAGLGRNASPPGVPPSPWESGVAVGHDLNLPRLTPGLGGRFRFPPFLKNLFPLKRPKGRGRDPSPLETSPLGFQAIIKSRLCREAAKGGGGQGPPEA